MLIPLPDAIKIRGDFCAIGTAAAAYFKLIPWAELAACAAFVYTALRIVEFIVSWIKGRKSHD